ncbi:MAG: ImmA/IrrE family metallo-endopeptidase [Bacteroidetes bacterium]|nr:ImmA/IrrE family metallo-endopeptidase [Bacteroidota bacterium]
MRNFSSIQEAHWINGPAAVDLKTAVLYINPLAFRKLSETAQKFVILHELGHLNVAEDSEQEADKWAFFKSMKLGDDKIQVLKDFYKSLPFSSKEQTERSEQMLRLVFEDESNEALSPIAKMFNNSTTRQGNLRGWIPIVIAAASAAVSITSTIVKNVKDNKATKAATAANEAAEKEIQRGAQEALLTSEAELQMLAKLQEEKELRESAEATENKNNNKTIIITAVIVAVIAISAWLLLKK